MMHLPASILAAFLALVSTSAYGQVHTAKEPSPKPVVSSLQEALRSFKSGNYRETLVHLQGDIDPSAPDAGHRLFLRGMAHLRVREFTAASNAFLETSFFDNESMDYALYFHARCLLQTGDHTGALTALEELMAMDNTLLYHEARILHAHTVHLNGSFDESLRLHGDVLRDYPDHPAQHELLLRLAQANLETGRSEEASKLFRDIPLYFPYSNAALQADTALLNLRQTGVLPPSLSNSERLEHGRFLRTERRWEDAKQWLTRLQAELQHKTGTQASELLRLCKEELASLAFGREDYEEALVRYRSLWEENPSRSIGHQIARTLQRLGQIADAEAAHWRRIEAGESRGKILRDVSELFLWEGQYERAAEVLKESVVATERDAWIRAWLLLRTGHYRHAASAFVQHGQRYRQARAKSRYWEARAHQISGNRERALSLFQSLLNDVPFGYYGIQASNRLYEAGRIPREYQHIPPHLWPDTTIQGAKIHWVDTPPRTGWLPKGPKDTKEALLQKLHFPPDTPGARALAKVLFLIQVGMEEEAATELRHLIGTLMELRSGASLSELATRAPRLIFDNRPKSRRKGLWGSPNTLTRTISPEGVKTRIAELRWLNTESAKVLPSLVALHRHMGEWHNDARLAQQSLGSAGPNQENAALWSRIIPDAYDSLLQLKHKAFGVHPDLTRGLMRVESRYNPLAISRSEARGLMQVLPRTGRLIARALGYREFAKDLLLNPHVSIHFGAWYLSQLTRKFRGQEPLAVCSYNTGPFNVSYWLSRKPSISFDMFLEEVPWIQPRRYVKKVLANIQLATWLRTGVPVLYVSNSLDGRFRDNINF